MSGSNEKRKISQKVEYEIEWTFDDIFSYTKEDDYYISPIFIVPGSEWYLRMYPNGETGNDSVGWIGLYLSRRCDDSTPPTSVSFDLGVKKVDGTVELRVRNTADRMFGKKTPSWGFRKFLQRSELSEKRLELASSGCLTITCTMRVKDVLDSTSRLIEVSNDLNKLWVSKKDCDATLKVEDEEFPVHKSVLRSRSAVFQAMFQADMKEKNTGVVDVDDCHPEAFKDFIKYMYCGQFENSGDVIELYKIAHKYRVESLMSACVQFMLSNLSVDNVLDVSLLANLFDEAELKDKSQEFVNEHFEDVVLTDRWTSLFKDNPSLACELITNMAKGAMKNKRTCFVLVLIGIMICAFLIFILFYFVL